MDSTHEPVFAVIFGSIIVLGLPLNVVTLWALLRHHRLKSPSAVYMINLAIADLMLIISLPMRIYYYATGTWQLSIYACNFSTMLFRNNIRCSAFFITFISVDRLLAVVYPLRSRHLRTLSNAWKAAALVWIVLTVLNIPESLAFTDFLKKNNSTCFEDAQSLKPKRIVQHVQAGLLFVMLVVNIVCTVMVSWTLHQHLSDSARVKNKVKVMLIFVMSLIVFTLCFLPLYISLLVTTTAQTSLICLASANCCLDPLLYYFSMDSFWKKKEDADLPREY